MPADNKRPSAPSSADAHGDGAPLDERLEPLEEFRGRSESWMKEITAQVARLASRNEDDERRKKGLDKRLGDIEQRIQSLLTLTEMLSMGSNPFVANGDTRPQEAPSSSGVAQARPAPEKVTAPTAGPEDVPAPVPSANGTQAAPAPSEAADPPPSPVTPAETAPPSAQADAEDDGPLDIEEVLSAAPKTAVPAPEDSEGSVPPQEAPPVKASPPAARPSRSYFSDLLATPRDARRPADKPAATAFPPPPEPVEPQPRRATSQGTAERLVLLEWAELLATRLPRNKIRDFLVRYEEAGWIDGPTASRVGALATGFQQESPDMPDVDGLHDVHVRSLVLLSFFEGAPIAQSEALDVLNEARQLAHGDWARNALR